MKTVIPIMKHVVLWRKINSKRTIHAEVQDASMLDRSLQHRDCAVSILRPHIEPHSEVSESPGSGAQRSGAPRTEVTRGRHVQPPSPAASSQLIRATSRRAGVAVTEGQGTLRTATVDDVGPANPAVVVISAGDTCRIYRVCNGVSLSNSTPATRPHRCLNVDLSGL